MTRRGWSALSALVILTAAVTWSARAAGGTDQPDLNGQWRLDPRASDAPPLGMPPGGSSGGEQGEHHGHGGGSGERLRWGGHGGGSGYGGGYGGHGGAPTGSADPSAAGGPGAPGASRPVRLPDLMHLTQTLDVVSFEDSSGKVVQEVGLMDAKDDTLMHPPGATVLHGKWLADTLQVERVTPRGKSTVGIFLEDGGKTLVIRTRMEAGGDLPEREFKRVYRKVVES